MPTRPSAGWYNAPLTILAGFFMRFTIRDVLWLTALIGLALGWFVDHRIVTAEAKLWTNRAVDAEMAMKSDGWIVDWRDADRGPYFVYPNGRTWAPYGR